MLTMGAAQVIISPANPVQGEPVTITYRPGPESGSLTDPLQPEVYALLWSDTGEPLFSSIPMDSGTEGWTATWMPDPGVLAVHFKIVDGEDSDDNTGVHWDFVVHDRSGNVLPGAYIAIGRSLVFEKHLPTQITQAEMVRALDAVRATSKFEREMESDSHGVAATYHYVSGLRWTMDQAPDRRALMAHALSLAEEVLHENPNDPYAMAAYITAQQHFGSRHQAADVSKQLITDHPGHPAAEEFMAWEASFPGGSANPARRIQAAQEFIRLYPDSRRQIVTDVLLPSYVALEQFDEALQWLDGYVHRRASMYHFLGDQMRRLDAGYATQAVSALERSLDLWGDYPGGDIPRPGYVTPREWDAGPYAARRHKLYLRIQMDYALALSAAGRLQESLQPARLACELNNGEELGLITDYLQVLYRAGRYEEALEVAAATVLSDHWDEGFLDIFKSLYVGKRGSEDGFAEELEYLQIGAMRERYKAQMSVKAAPDFSVEVHGGGELTLSDLAGKVVVLDFWALWCGPCMRAFPYFQQAQDYYADHPDVLLLALNTMENVHGDALRSRVQDFLDDNGYSFPVVYDYNRTAVARMYDVEGIPTRITIGRDNKIRFRDVGFSGEEMYLNMRAQIDLLLEEEL